MIIEKPPSFAGLLYSLISATCFGFLAILFKLGYDTGLNTGIMLTLRFFFAAVLLLPYICLTKRDRFIVSPGTLLTAFICGAFFYGVQSYCFAASLRYISASTSALILYIYPLTVMILSAIIFKTGITRGKVLAVVLIFTGCICVFYDAFNRQMDPRGLILATLAMISFSGYLIFLQKSLLNIDSTVFSFLVIVFAFLQCSIVYHPFDSPMLSLQQWIICFLLGLVPTVFAIVLLYKAIGGIGSSYTAIFSSIEPAVTILASAFVLHESVVFLQIMGMGLIIAGIMVPNFRAVRGHVFPS
jgi:drug/metabolite transporter (DMT)-like permease